MSLKPDLSDKGYQSLIVSKFVFVVMESTLLSPTVYIGICLEQYYRVVVCETAAKA